MSHTPPTSPPARPVVPIGLGSVAGYGAGVTALVAAFVDAIVGSSVDVDTRTLIISGISALVLTSLGRMFQAGMALLREKHVLPPEPVGTRFSGQGGYGAVELVVALLVVLILIFVLLRVA